MAQGLLGDLMIVDPKGYWRLLAFVSKEGWPFRPPFNRRRIITAHRLLASSPRRLTGTPINLIQGWLGVESFRLLARRWMVALTSIQRLKHAFAYPKRQHHDRCITPIHPGRSGQMIHQQQHLIRHQKAGTSPLFKTLADLSPGNFQVGNRLKEDFSGSYFMQGKCLIYRPLYHMRT